MLRQVATSLLPSALRCASHAEYQLARGFKAVADVEINLGDRETLKKYVGIRDHLSKQPATKGKFMEVLRDVLEAVQVLPDKSDYRRAVEATAKYRQQVCEANESDAAVEEVLDAHLEELIEECKEEMHLIPLMKENQPWDVDASYLVPVFDYQDASAVLNQPKK